VYSEKRTIFNLFTSLDLSVNFDGVGNCVVSHVEWLRNVVTVLRDLFLCLLEGFSDKVGRLHRADGEV